MAKLTAAAVRRALVPGRYGDGDTLYLNVTPTGTKSWIQRIVIDGRRHDIGLGPYPLISLAHARERAIENRLAIANGRNPLAEKRRTRIPTFRKAAEATFRANLPRWRDGKTAKNWMQGMEKRAFPVIGDMRVDRIGCEEVLRILKPIWTTHPEVARKLGQRIRATLQWCEAHGHVERNVAGDAINGALPVMSSVRKHHRSLPYAAVPGALRDIRACGASDSSRLCLEFLVLTATRSGEARGAAWEEFDLDQGHWCIATERTKANAKHIVPLSRPALVLLERARLAAKGPLAFPSPRSAHKALSDMTLMKLLHTVGLADRTTVHGFRSSFRTWASEQTDADHAVMELCLSHTVGSAVERAYARSDLLEKRRVLMEQWAVHCTGSPA